MGNEVYGRADSDAYCAHARGGGTGERAVRNDYPSSKAMTSRPPPAATAADVGPVSDGGAAAGADRGPRFDHRFERSSRDVLRLIAGLILILVGIALATVFSDALAGFEADLVAVLRSVPEGLAVVLFGTIKVLAVVVGAGIVGWLVWRRRWPLLGRFLLADLVALALLALVELVIGRAPPAALAQVRPPSWISAFSSPLDTGWLATAVATFTVARTLLPPAWRRVGVAMIALGTLGVVAHGRELPLDVVAAAAVGWFSAALVLLVFGRPVWPVRGSDVAAALRRTSLDVLQIRPASVDARGSTPFFAETGDGGGLFVKVLGREERSSDLLFRFYRWLRFRGLGDETIAASLKQTVEHEAMVSLLAAAEGVRTPRLLAVAALDRGRFGLAFERIAGQSLDQVNAALLTDEVLGEIWRLVGELRAAGIAHRDLRLANLFLDDTGRAWLIDFGFSAAAATADQLAGDVAELLCSMSLVVGPQRTVDAAVAALGTGPVRDALPRIQPDAVSTATRRAMNARKPLAHELATVAAAAVGVDKIEYRQLQRVQPRQLLTLLATGVGAYFLIHQISQLDNIGGTLASMNWGWALAAVGASAVTYFGAALNLVGGVAVRLPIGLATAVQVAGSFVNRVTPVGIGGMAVNVRYLQRSGVDSASSVAAVGLTRLIGVLVHLSMTAVFVVWAGSKTTVADLPGSTTILLILVAAAALVGLVVVLRPLRRLLRTVVLPAVKTAAGSLREALNDPARLGLSAVGSALLNLASIAALAASLRAFDVTISLAAVGAVYLAGTAIASAAPTPGGVGAVEAALIAGLTVVGVPTEHAVPAVLVYRLATFWLPVLPGWLAFTVLARRQKI